MPCKAITKNSNCHPPTRIDTETTGVAMKPWSLQWTLRNHAWLHGCEAIEDCVTRRVSEEVDDLYEEHVDRVIDPSYSLLNMLIGGHGEIT